MNVARDARQETALQELGWRVLVIWERETKNKAAVERRLACAGQTRMAGENSRRAPGKCLSSKSRRVGWGMSVASATALSSGDET